MINPAEHDPHQNEFSMAGASSSPRPAPSGNILTRLIDFPWLLSRVQLVLLNPTSCWEQIRSEALDSLAIIKRYVLPLAAIPVMIVFLKVTVLGFESDILGTLRIPFFSALFYSVVFLAALIASIFVAALIIQKLAPKFESQVDANTAFAIVAYSLTPSVPLLFTPLIVGSFIQTVFWIASAYGVYLWFKAMACLITTPEPKKMPYFASSLGGSIVATGVLFWLVNSLLFPSMPVFDFGKFNDQVQVSPEEIQKGLEMLQKNLQTKWNLLHRYWDCCSNSPLC